MWKNSTILVLAGGVLGGLTSVLLSILGMLPLAVQVTWWAFPLVMFLGALAAYVGVFFVFNTDRNDKNRLVAWAILLGILWQPVILAGLTLARTQVQQRQASKDVARIDNTLEEIARQPPTTQSVMELTGVGTDLAVLTTKVNNLPDEQVRSALNLRLSEAVKNYAAIARTHPAYAASAAATLESVRVHADPQEQQTLITTVERQLPDVRMIAPHLSPSNAVTTTTGPAMHRVIH
jgi:hypothetical protein